MYTNKVPFVTGVPTPPGKSWILFLENSRTWKIWKNILENYAFFIGYNGKQAVYTETM